MDLTHIHHVAIIVQDYEKARHFYVDLLGFKVIRDVERPERNDRILYLALSDCELEIFVKPDAPPRPGYPQPESQGLRHLAFKVESVEQTVKDLNILGIETESVRSDTFTGKPMTFFHDPDGLPLEIHE